MNPTQHSTNNLVLGAPPGWDQTQTYCSALPVTRAVTPEGQPLVLSFWRPSAEELQLLNSGGLVALSVYGNTMPPVWLEARHAHEPL
ncbi:MAG: hypothetical protein C0423_13985 [Methylibium sp.]|nr:hypothetical protein [Methylibium sp.]